MIILVLVVAAGCTTTPKPAPPRERPASELVDRLGDSMETAVEVPANAPNEGIDFMNEWIYERFGRFRRLNWGIANANNRKYEVITVELPDQTQHKVFFDITENWKNWTPK